MANLPFTLRQLEVFSSLCATKSFRISAENLGISQASVSNQLKTLEEQLGVALLDRKPGRRPLITPPGAAFLQDLQGFEAATRALAAHRRANPVKTGSTRFQLLIGQGLAENFIRPKLGGFLTRHPEVELVFDLHLPRKELDVALARAKYDFALVHQIEPAPVADFLRPVALVRGGIYGHRRLTEGRVLPLTADEVSALPFALPRISGTYERDELKALERHGIRPAQIVGRPPYFDVFVSMLESGVAVGMFTEAMIPLAMREAIVLLYPTETWQLLWFRKDDSCGYYGDIIENFLLESVVGDPRYGSARIA